MQRHMLKSKIHRATVTAADPDYIGSITIDAELMRRADLVPNEQVHVWDIANGARMVTYAIEGERSQVQINGAAARLVSVGDRVIIASYGAYDDAELATYSPVVVHVDEGNRTARVDSNPEVLLGRPAAGEWIDEVPGSLGADGSGGLGPAGGIR